MPPEPKSLIMSNLPLAHETWFEDGVFPTDWGFATETTSVLLLLAAVAAAVGLRAVASLRDGVDLPFLARLAPYMPFAVRLHLAVSLVGLLSLGFYLSPAMDLQADPAGILLGAVMGVVAIGMATGWHTRRAAWLLIAAGPIGMLEFGVWPVLQRIDLLGLAIFVLLAGPGRWSADQERGTARESGPAELTHAILALRVAAGLALIVVAFAEKLATPDLAVAFLADHPELNVAHQLGLEMGDLEFIRLAGAVEVLFGLLLISGALPQVVVLIVGVPFNVTLWFFGNTELVGHLPIYGAMLAILVWGSDPHLRPLVGALPWRGALRAGIAPGRALRLSVVIALLAALLVVAPALAAPVETTGSDPLDARGGPPVDLELARTSYDPAAGAWSLTVRLHGPASEEEWAMVNARLWGPSASREACSGVELADMRASTRPSGGGGGRVTASVTGDFTRAAAESGKRPGPGERELTLSLADPALAGHRVSCVTVSLSHNDVLDTMAPLDFAPNEGKVAPPPEDVPRPAPPPPPPSPPDGDAGSGTVTIGFAQPARRIRVGADGTVRVTLLPFTRDVTGRVVIRSRRGAVLGVRRFSAAAWRTVNVEVRLKPAARRTVRRHGRVPARVTASARDSGGGQSVHRTWRTALVR